MGAVRELPHDFSNLRPTEPLFGGIGGDRGKTDARVAELEKMTTEIRERVARMESGLGHVATKCDVSSLESTLLKWFIGTAIALTGLVFAAAKLIH